MRKLAAIAVLALATLVFGVGSTLAGGSYGKQKVVYHVNYDDPKQQMAALRNIQNHINAVGKENLDLRVIMHGKGYTLLKRANDDMTVQSKVINLKGQGIKMQICNNTLVGKKISYKNDLFDVDKADIVPSGVAELAHLQAAGYSYVKP